MQHSQPHITLYWPVIFFSWGGKMLRKVESLMMVLLSTYIDTLSTTSDGGLTMLLCSYLTYAYN